tara:strand:- start:297 stop:605 length:309 start_codon:yes stop_codon:yes gene_type:complete
LFLFNTRDGSEFRLCLMRRFAKTLWGQMLRLGKSDPQVAVQKDPFAKKSVVAFRCSSLVSPSAFTKEHETKPPAELPLNDARLLVTKFKATRVANSFNLMFS